MFEAIQFEGVSRVSGTTIASYAPFEEDVLDVTVMFKPEATDLYGPHVLVMGYADYNGHMVNFRCRSGLENDGSILCITIDRLYNYTPR